MADQRNIKNFSGTNYDKYRYIAFDLGGGYTYTAASKQDVPIAEALATAKKEAEYYANYYAKSGATGVSLLGQKVETQTRSAGAKSTTYSYVPISEDPGRRSVDTRTAADLAYEKAAGIGAGNVVPGTRVAGGYVQNDGSVGSQPPQTQSPTQDQLYASLAEAQRQLNLKTGNNTVLPSLGQASAPSTAGGINSVPQLQFPSVNSSFGNVSNASASTSGMSALLDGLVKQQEDYRAQADKLAAQQAKDTKSFLSFLKDQPSQTDLRNEAYQQAGINPADYFAEQRAKIAEIDQLTQEYNNTKAAMEAEIAKTFDMQASTGFITNRQAQIERNYAPRLTAQSANINSKSAVLQALQGNFAEATNFVNQAVQDAVADQKFKIDTFTMMYQINQDTLSRMDKKYQDAFNQAWDIAKLEYQTALDEKNRMGELIVDAASKGVDLSSYMSGSYDSLLRAYSSQVSPVEAKSNSSASDAGTVSDLLQQSINAGQTPETAARDVAVYYESLGIPVSNSLLSSWINLARTIKPGRQPVATIPSRSTGSYFLESVGSTVGDFFSNLFS